MRRRDTDRRDRRRGRHEANRQTKGDLGGKRQTENMERGGLAELAKGDLDGGDEGEEVEGFSGGGAEGAGNTTEGRVLDHLQLLDQGMFGGIRPVPQLAAIVDSKDMHMILEGEFPKRGSVVTATHGYIRSVGCRFCE